LLLLTFSWDKEQKMAEDHKLFYLYLAAVAFGLYVLTDFYPLGIGAGVLVSWVIANWLVPARTVIGQSRYHKGGPRNPAQ